jgi:cation diffusion facilitator family transporter
VQEVSWITKDTNKEKSRVALLSVASNTLLTSSKVVVGLVSGSVSILSEGIHSAIDLLAACIAFFAVRESGKPADARHAYGHGKIENLSGTIEALLIFVAVFFIVREAVIKINAIVSGAGGEIGGLAFSLGLIVMGCSALINIFVSYHLMKVARKTDSVALEADALHLRTDVYTSAGVFVALLVIWLTGWYILDPIIALAVAAMITKAAFDLLKKAFFPLIDTSLPEAEKEIITGVLAGHNEEILEYHDLRTRKAGADRHVDLHLVVPKLKSVGEVHELCDLIEQEICAQLPGAQVLIHAEPCDIAPSQCPFEAGQSDYCHRCKMGL